MTCINSHRIEIAEDPVNPLYYRWQIFQDGKLLDLSGFAYATARSAKEAAQVALKWHLILEPLRSRLDMSGFHPQH
ncbi:hypothetical protein GCM10007884_51520 [Methylobacterium brachythecii]|uniref:DUF1508 domain-containing protein n=1 Tax=Methylobacterium brachythecii TaxID=1176177 RepID=A0ABQ6D9V5_9HYPH|nr:hypothetical protein GCM10007884_51520 [Methylobacterium brachythecii]